MKKPTSLILPLLLLAGLYWLLRKSDTPAPSSETVETKWQSESFSSMPPGDLPPNWAAPRGTIQIVENAGVRMLCFLPEPMVEGRVLVPGVLRGGGAIRARMSGESGKRAHPRFAVGLNSDAEFHLRYVFAEKRLELITPKAVDVNGTLIPEDHRLASAPLELANTSPLWLELRMNPEGLCEGRCWAEGTPRPAHPPRAPPTPGCAPPPDPRVADPPDSALPPQPLSAIAARSSRFPRRGPCSAAFPFVRFD